MKKSIPYKYIGKKNDVFVREFSTGVYHPACLHMHDHFELLLIISETNVKIVSNGNEAYSTSPALIIHRPITYHLTDTAPDTTEYNTYTVYFTSEILKRLPQDIVDLDRIITANCMIITLDEVRLTLFQKYIKLLKREKNSNRKILLLGLILNLISEYSNTANTIYLNSLNYNYIVEILHKIMENFDQNLIATDLADEMYISVSKLNDDFRKMTGTSIKAFITAVRLRRAREMLITGKESITNIAYNCGFCNASHFIKCFKNETGMSPGQFIKKSKEDSDFSFYNY